MPIAPLERSSSESELDRRSSPESSTGTPSPVTPRRGVWWSVAAIALLALSAAAWGWFRPLEAAAVSGIESTAPAPTHHAAVAQIDVDTVRRSPLPLNREATGYLEARRTVVLTAEAGGTVVERLVHEGQWVEARQVLVRLDPRDRQLELAEAEAEWLTIRARYAVDYESSSEPIDDARGKASEDDLAEDLFAQGLISRHQLLQRQEKERNALLAGEHQHEVRAATSGLAQAEQRLARARLALERTEITAPFSGRVADLDVELGQRVHVGDLLLQLVDDRRLEVEVKVLEADILKLRRGAPATIRIPAAAGTFEGNLSTINPRVDPETGTGRVVIALENPRDTLMHGLFAHVDLEVGRLDDRLSVPSTAILERQDRNLVFRIENDRALWTYVRTGARSGDRIEIVDGLAEGDVVAIAGHFALAHEAVVEIRQ